MNEYISSKKRERIDKIFKFSIYIITFTILIPLFLIFGFIITNGIKNISIEFLIKNPVPVGETGGGILNALIGTFILIILSSVLAIPFGITAGIYLSENSNKKYAQYISTFVDVFQGIPSIVLGIIAYVWIVLPVKKFSALSGAVALSIMMLPTIIKATEETLKMIPYSLKEAAYSLGVPYHRTILKVILPAAFSGILSGTLVSIGRISGETAPLLFTAFGSNLLEWNIFKPMNSLPLLIFNYAKSPYPEWHELAWSASLVLITIVFLFNLLASIGEKKWKIKF
ncbi:MAG: phosphate ABC transporter permease PstA [Deltaproteobacteria bacterium]|nr:phosphate ABC transporter permease PstA [Deltaproteobacteria bacterium]